MQQRLRKRLKACRPWGLAIMCLACGWPAHAADAATTALQRTVDANTKSGFAGEVLVGDAKAVRFHAVAGLSNAQTRQLHRKGQVWRWASVSKQVAAALLMQQVDAGRVALTDSVAQHLPGFNSPQAAQITVRQLLQHLSGLPNPEDSLPDPNTGLPSFYSNAGVDANIDPLAYCAGPPKRAPGEAFEYNNCDTLVLAALLEKVSGMPYDKLLQAKVSGPLKLPGLGLATSGQPRATAVGVDAKGQAVPTPRLARYGAAAALEGSALDLLAFDRALMARRLVSEASTQVMWTGDPKLGYVALGAWRYDAPLRGCDKPVALVERRGDVGGIQVRNLIAPDAGMAVIMFSNQAEFEFGEVWQGKGMTHDVLAAALCTAAAKTQ
jgi:D-alanyl-D-alanine carboxypeptidase